MNRLQPFRLERYFARYEFTAQYLLSSSDCEAWAVHDLLALEQGSVDELHKVWLGYTESRGKPSLRKEICRLYSSVTPDDVLVHTGAEEAILLFMNAALEAGDEVVVHTPCYQALAEIPRSIGCKVIGWDPERQPDIKPLLGAKTKAIVVNFPHNPTGFLPDQAFMRALAATAHERGIIVFCDEVYRESEHEPGFRLPAACDLSETAVSLGVLSKTYGLAGLRTGWVATRNRRVLERMAELKDYTTICNNAPGELLAEIALRNREKLAARNLEIIRTNLDRLDGFFARHEERFTWKRPKAGPIAFPSLKAGNADEFCRIAIEKGGVMLLPGSVFGDYPSNFRIGFGRRNMPEALAQLEALLK